MSRGNSEGQWGAWGLVNGRPIGVEIKNRIAVLCGGLLLALVGRRRFHWYTQAGNPILHKIARTFCQSDAAIELRHFETMTTDRSRRRISATVLKFYGDDSLHGYADKTFKKGGNVPLRDQQRGQILPVVAQLIRTRNIRAAIEIGTAQGDNLIELAREFPETKFTGIDLSVVNAMEKYAERPANVQFVRAYALDRFQGGEMNGRAPLVFGTNTFCCFVPGELEDFLAAVAAAGTTAIAVCEPIVGPFRPSQRRGPESVHMSSYMWGHNYPGYFKAAGFNVTVNRLIRAPNRLLNVVVAQRP